MPHFWLIVATSVLLGVLVTAMSAYLMFTYEEHQLVRDLKGDFDRWLLQDFKIAQKMPWPATPNFSDPSYSTGTAEWCIKAVVEAYAIRYNSSYKPAIPFFTKKPHRFFSNGEFAGYGAFSGDNQTVLLAFHGTSSVADVMEDLEAAQVPFPGSSTARVFDGLYTRTAELQKDVMSWFDTLKEPKPRMLITGHSSGAAVAVYLGARLESPTTVYTFGCPKLGNHAFQRLIDEKQPTLSHYRVVNAADVIPTMPMGTNENQYWPSGEPHITYLETGQSSLNHGLSTYAHALEASHDSFTTPPP